MCHHIVRTPMHRFGEFTVRAGSHQDKALLRLIDEKPLVGGQLPRDAGVGGDTSFLIQRRDKSDHGFSISDSPAFGNVLP